MRTIKMAEAHHEKYLQTYKSLQKTGKNYKKVCWKSRLPKPLHKNPINQSSKNLNWKGYFWRKKNALLSLFVSTWWIIAMPAHKARNFKSVESCRTVERADDPSVKYVTLCFIRSQVTSSPTKILMDCWYSRTFTNGHLSTTATFFGGQSLHWLLFKPLYKGHFLLPPTWPLLRGSTVV